jgi:hypothetical protein
MCTATIEHDIDVCGLDVDLCPGCVADLQRQSIAQANVIRYLRDELEKACALALDRGRKVESLEDALDEAVETMARASLYPFPPLIQAWVEGKPAHCPEATGARRGR